MAEISAVFQQCFCLNYLFDISAVFQQFQPLFFRGCRKTAEISAIFLQHAHIVWKRQKFRPFSYNPECFGRFPTTVFRPFFNNGFRPFSYKFSAILQLIVQPSARWTHNAKASYLMEASSSAHSTTVQAQSRQFLCLQFSIFSVSVRHWRLATQSETLPLEADRCFTIMVF